MTAVENFILAPVASTLDDEGLGRNGTARRKYGSTGGEGSKSKNRLDIAAALVVCAVVLALVVRTQLERGG